MSDGMTEAMRDNLDAPPAPASLDDDVVALLTKLEVLLRDDANRAHRIAETFDWLHGDVDAIHDEIAALLRRMKGRQ